MKLARGIAYLTADEMREVDETTIEEYGIDILSLMENAGLAIATLAWRLLGENRGRGRVACLVGRGNNGGDGLVAARHLHNWGAQVTIVLGAHREELEGVSARQLATIDRIDLKIVEALAPLSGYHLLVDALLGYNVKGDPREPVAGLIRAANDSDLPILAADLPSGLNPTSGEPYAPCIRAAATLTLGFPKAGFLNPTARPFIGHLYLADISLPRKMYSDRSMRGAFTADRIVRLW